MSAQQQTAHHGGGEGKGLEIAVATAAVVVLSTLGAGELAAVVFGAHRALPSPGGAGVGIFAWFLHPGDPALGWPLADRAVLSSAPGMWASLVVVLALLGCAIWALAKLWHASSPSQASAAHRAHKAPTSKERRLGVDARARLATARDVAPLVVDGPHRGRVILGRLAGEGMTSKSKDRNSPLLATEEEGPGAHLSPLRKHDPARGGRTSIIVFGPSGSGKTSGLAIPAILEWDGPVLALSVKDDLLATTIARRRTLGEVRVFDPTGALAPRITTSCWSPLRRCKTLAGANKVAGGLTETPSSSDDLNSKFFREKGIALLGPYLFAAAAAGLGMGDVERWCAVQDGVVPEGKHEQKSECAEILTHLGAPSALAASAATAAASARAKATSSGAFSAKVAAEAAEAAKALSLSPDNLDAKRNAAATKAKAETAFNAAAAAVVAATKAAAAAAKAADAVTALSKDATIALRTAGAVWRLTAVTRDGAFANASVGVAPWASDQVASSAARDEINLRWLMTGAGTNTLYACAPADHQEGLQPVFAGMIQEIFDDAFAAASRFGGELPRRLLIVLDEAANICPLRSLPRYASTVRSVGITLVTMFQSEAQVIERWRGSADTVIENHVTKLGLAGISDPKTLTRFSTLVGEHEVEKSSESDDGARKSTTISTQRERLLPLDLIRRLPPGDALMFTGSLLPVHLHLRPWWKDAKLKDLAEPPPLEAEVVDAEPDSTSRPAGLGSGAIDV